MGNCIRTGGGGTPGRGAAVPVPLDGGAGGINQQQQLIEETIAKINNTIAIKREQLREEKKEVRLREAERDQASDQLARMQQRARAAGTGDAALAALEIGTMQVKLDNLTEQLTNLLSSQQLIEQDIGDLQLLVDNTRKSRTTLLANIAMPHPTRMDELRRLYERTEQARRNIMDEVGDSITCANDDQYDAIAAANRRRALRRQRLAAHLNELLPTPTAPGGAAAPGVTTSAATAYGNSSTSAASAGVCAGRSDAAEFDPRSDADYGGYSGSSGAMVLRQVESNEAWANKSR